ncbi:MAG: sigma factor-like helix-turn-helix DNA-binding protein [Phenylobacterium sp.]
MSEPFKSRVVALIPSLRGYAMSLTRSQEAADALVEAALKAAWSGRDEAGANGDMQTWLLGLIRAEHLRRGGEAGPAEPAEGSGPAREWRARYGEMLQALDRLGPTARDALLLVAASGVGYEEAGQILGVSGEAMRGRVRRARTVLTDLVQTDANPHDTAPR